MKSFRLQILASDHMVYDGDALSLTLPTTEGMTGILADHSNVIMAVVPGALEYLPAAGSGYDAPGGAAASESSGGRQTVIVSDGLLKAENGEVMVLVDTAEKPEDIDEARARRAEEKAREELKRTNTVRDHAFAEAELSRALSRIKASKPKHKL